MTIKVGMLEKDGEEFSVPNEYLLNVVETASFSHAGNASSGRWLSNEGNPSNNTPWLSTEICEIRKLALAVEGSATATATIYKNGSAVDTISLSAASSGVKTLTTPIALVSGDKLSAQITSGSCTRPTLLCKVHYA